MALNRKRLCRTDFHPTMSGLTGPYDAVKAACKSYRVYFSTPPDAKPTDDYLVDHSILWVTLFVRDQTGVEGMLQFLLDGSGREIRRRIWEIFV